MSEGQPSKDGSEVIPVAEASPKQQQAEVPQLPVKASRPTLTSKANKVQFAKTAGEVMAEATEAFHTAYRELHQRHFHSVHEELAFLREDYVASRRARLLQRKEIVRLSRALRQCRQQLEDAREQLAQRNYHNNNDDVVDEQNSSVTLKSSRSGERRVQRSKGQPSSALWLYAAAARATHATPTSVTTAVKADAQKKTQNIFTEQSQSEHTEAADVQVVDNNKEGGNDEEDTSKTTSQTIVAVKSEIAAGTLPGREGRANHFNTVQLINELRRNLARRDTALEALRLDHSALAHARNTLETRLQRAQEELRVMTRSRNEVQEQLVQRDSTIAALETRCHAAEQEVQNSKEALAQLQTRCTTLELLQQQPQPTQPQSYTEYNSYGRPSGNMYGLVRDVQDNERVRQQQQQVEDWRAMKAMQERLAQVQRAHDEACSQRDALRLQLQQGEYNETMTHVLQSQNETLKQRMAEMAGELHQVQQREKTLQVHVEREVTARLRSEHAQQRLQRALERSVHQVEALQAELHTLKGRLGLEQGKHLVHKAHHKSVTKDVKAADSTNVNADIISSSDSDEAVDAAALHSENKGYAALMRFNDTLQERLRTLEAELRQYKYGNSSLASMKEERRALVEDNAVLAAGAAELLRGYQTLKEQVTSARSGVRERIRQAQHFVDVNNTTAPTSSRRENSSKDTIDVNSRVKSGHRASRTEMSAMQNTLQQSERHVRQLQEQLRIATRELREYEMLLSHLDAQGAVTTWLKRNQSATAPTSTVQVS